MSLSVDFRIHTLNRTGQKKYQLSFYNPVTRKRIRKKFKLQKEAEQFAEKLKEQFMANGTGATSAHTINYWMKSYLELNNRPLIKRLGEPFFLAFIENFGHVPAMNVTQIDLLCWLQNIQTERSYTANSMRNIKSSINQFFQFIVDSKALQENPMDKTKAIEGLPPKDRTVLTESEIKDLLQRLKAASPDLIYPVVFLLAHTGARLDEILTLKWKDVNFENGTIQLLWTKNGEDRLIHPSNEVLDYLKSLPRTHENVVVSQYKKEWTHSQYRKQFNKFRRKINFHLYWCNHVLRHSFATNYLKQGNDMLQLQQILGHKTLQMTVNLYGQIEAADVHDVSPFDF